jgi:hypothetical protein
VKLPASARTMLPNDGTESAFGAVSAIAARTA